ncbi:MAG: OmpA-like transrane domain protein [Gammaproteobacteria bacterium]|jgi:opacity protein-like surface antigen|nr:OmpA-like transrane domain protein [Gammaproteobacteria bacterium]
MSKKNIAISTVLSFVSLGVVASALANYNDNYYTQAPVPIATPSPYAYDQSGAGFVIGAEAGYANTHWDNANINSSNLLITGSGTGFAGRVFLGYDFNRYIGFEGGYIYLPTATLALDIDNNTSVGVDISNYAFDFLGKISVPVTSGLSLYAKAGLGYFHSSISGPNLGQTGDASHFGPAFGVGAGYEIIPNLAINLSWLRYSGNGDMNSDNYQPNPDVGLLGLSYKFPVRN